MSQVRHSPRHSPLRGGGAGFDTQDPQGFDWIHIDRRDHILLRVIAWNGASFGVGDEGRFAFVVQTSSVADLLDELPSRTQIWQPESQGGRAWPLLNP